MAHSARWWRLGAVIFLAAFAGMVYLIGSSAVEQENRAALAPLLEQASKPGTGTETQAAPAKPAATPAAPSRGTLKVDRVRTGEAEGYGYALASYVNDSRQTFSRVVTVQCDAFAGEGRKIGTNTRSFFVHEHGPIVPGFRGTVEVPVELDGETLDSMECWIAQAR